VDSKVNSKQNALTIEDIEKMMETSVASYGAPDQLTMGVSTFVDYINSIGGIPHGQKSKHFMKIRDRLHGGLKTGAITWHTSEIVENAAEAFERMGFFKYAPKD
jgi:hypothetical protein